jgi:hypothetical protein
MPGTPKRLRIQDPDAINHVMARGDGRLDIGGHDGNRDRPWRVVAHRRRTPSRRCY